MDLDAAGSALIAGGRRLAHRGLIAAAEGNLSVRLDGERWLVTPAGVRKDELSIDDLIVVRSDHDLVAARSRSGLAPTSDLAIHRAVRAARPEVQAIVHAHLPASLGLTLAGEIPDPAVLPETARFLRRVPFVAIGEMGSTELAGRIVAALTDGPPPLADVVLLERHGAIALGSDVDGAVDRLDLLEVLCRAWRDALLVRAARAALT
jgi:L-fuculose-phosphate aldolase